jgi:hypothetical protein
MYFFIHNKIRHMPLNSRNVIHWDQGYYGILALIVFVNY